MTTVLLDTNALLMPFQFGLNPYKQLKELIPNTKIITLQECVDELKKIRPRSWESVIKLGLSNGLIIKKSTTKASTVDDLIVKESLKNKYIVLTQDKELKKKLLNKSLRLVVMRQKKYLELIG